MNIPTDAAMDAVQLIIGIMEYADKEGPAAQINLGPDVVKKFRSIYNAVMEANNT